MSKEEFLSALRKRLNGLPAEDVDERILFYDEMIDDHIEDGESEEEAIEGIGNIDEVVEQIMEDIPLAKIVKERVKPKKKLGGAQIALLIITSPIWVSLLISLFAVVFSVYVTIWSLVVSLFAVDLSLAISFVASIPAGIALIGNAQVAGGIWMMFAGLACAGFSVLLFYGCVYFAKGAIKLAKVFLKKVKGMFIVKEEI
ncbi:MAG: DUF1700 domain-containing protein [Eubacterium sp.]|nr:DUF1700 domain-containing protein [Eubacterium sp.]